LLIRARKGLFRHFRGVDAIYFIDGVIYFTDAAIYFIVVAKMPNLPFRGAMRADILPAHESTILQFRPQKFGQSLETS